MIRPQRPRWTRILFIGGSWLSSVCLIVLGLPLIMMGNTDQQMMGWFLLTGSLFWALIPCWWDYTHDH